MKLTVMKPTEIIATHIRIVAPDFYDGEDMPLDFPMRRPAAVSDPPHFKKKDCCGVWDVVVDIDTGVILGWPKTEEKSELHLKVTDSGYYELLSNGEVLNGSQDYVPGCVPGKYGDYIVMTIDTDGRIEEWKDHCTCKSVMESFFPKPRR